VNLCEGCFAARLRALLVGCIRGFAATLAGRSLNVFLAPAPFCVDGSAFVFAAKDCDEPKKNKLE